MKKVFIGALCGFVAVLTIVYLTAAGVQWQWNPGLWEKDFRSGAFIMGAFFAAIAAVYGFLFANDLPKNSHP